MAREKDIAGMKYGRFTVLSRVGSKNNSIYWNCLCDCGNLREVKGTTLRRKKFASCGCGSNWKNEERKINLVGERFERLLVVEESNLSKPGNIKWKCLCDCGNVVDIGGRSLRSHKIKSCGCYRREVSAVAQGHRNRISKEFITNRLSQKGYELLSEYNGSNKSATMRCITCSLIFTRRVSTSLYDIHGCPSCSKAFNGFIGSDYFAKNPEMRSKPCKLYLIEFKGNDEHFWKVGLTRQTIKQRICGIPYTAISITIIEKTMEEIYQLEKQIKSKYRHHRYLPKLTFGGHSECFKQCPEIPCS
jgi:hypothetical protein